MCVCEREREREREREPPPRDMCYTSMDVIIQFLCFVWFCFVMLFIYFNFIVAIRKVARSTRTFYLLPKIHKPVNTWPDNNTPPGRLIISDCGSESYDISEYIETHLKPIANRHERFVKNTKDLLSKLSKEKIPKD